jgi:hypothetical protein
LPTFSTEQHFEESLMLIGIQPKILHFKDCKKSDLIKLTIKDKTRLCICGVRNNETWNILVLDAANGTHLINVMGSFGIGDEFQDKTAVSYGTEYRLEIVPTSAVDIDGGPLMSSPGCLTIHKDEVAIAYRRSNSEMGVFDPSTGQQNASRGYSTAAFANWRILLPVQNEWVAVYEFNASNGKVDAATA